MKNKQIRVIIPYTVKKERWFFIRPTNQKQTKEEMIEFLENVINGRGVFPWEAGAIYEHAASGANLEVNMSPKEEWKIQEFETTDESWNKDRESREAVSQQEAQTACESILRSVRKMSHNDVNMELFWKRFEQVRSYVNHTE